MTFESVVVQAVGVGAATIAHVLAKLLHVHASAGHARFNVDLDHGVENDELKKFERLELFTNEVADGLRTIEHHLVVTEVQFELAARAHDLVELSPRPTGHDVGIAILQPTNVEIIQRFSQSFFVGLHQAPLECADRSRPTP